MRSEFCVVESIDSNTFTLKNTIDERYYVNIALLGNNKEGDKVVLIYRSRYSLSDGEFTADVYAIYPDDDTFADADFQ